MIPPDGRRRDPMDLWDRDKREGIERLFPVFVVVFGLGILTTAGIVCWAVIRLILHFT